MNNNSNNNTSREMFSSLNLYNKNFSKNFKKTNTNNNLNNNLNDNSFNGLIRNNYNNYSFYKSNSSKNIYNNNNEIFDQEKINEEINNLQKNIKLKTKEYNYLKSNQELLEKENLKTMKIIENLINDCKQIDNPIEHKIKQSKEDKKQHKKLKNNLEKKLKNYKKELDNKTNELTQLKMNNEKILRLFEIESKLKNAKKTLINLTKDFNNSVIQINNIDNECQKFQNDNKNLILINSKLRKETEDL